MWPRQSRAAVICRICVSRASRREATTCFHRGPALGPVSSAAIWSRLSSPDRCQNKMIARRRSPSGAYQRRPACRDAGSSRPHRPSTTGRPSPAGCTPLCSSPARSPSWPQCSRSPRSGQGGATCDVTDKAARRHHEQRLQLRHPGEAKARTTPADIQDRGSDPISAEQDAHDRAKAHIASPGPGWNRRGQAACGRPRWPGRTHAWS